MSIKKILINLAVPLFLIVTYISCVANRAASNTPRLINAMTIADSVFDSGNYENAKKRYIQIRDNDENIEFRALAQYKIGYLNIYYENPFSDYSSALLEFRKFVKDFPKNARVSEANNYIRLLSNLNDITTKNRNNIEGISIKQDELIGNLLELQKVYLKCNNISDSLNNKIQILESVIEDVEKIN